MSRKRPGGNAPKRASQNLKEWGVNRQQLYTMLDGARQLLDEKRQGRFPEPESDDFSYELEAFIVRHVAELMEQGYSEDEAWDIALDNAAAPPESYMEEPDEFDDMDDSQLEGYAISSEAIGMYYAAFMTIGMALGAFFGFAAERTLVGAGVGVAVGLGAGTGLGLVTHGMITMLKNR